MITEDYVSFETAKLLKEKGFNYTVHQYYKENGEVCNNPKSVASWRVKTWCPCVTLQMAMKWLREKYHIHIDITIEGNGSYIDYKYVIKDFSIIFPTRNYDSIDAKDEGRAKTYEEAVETAIKYCLENLI